MSGPDFVGAVDQGTTSTRFVIFDRRGRITAMEQLEHRQHYPRPGWVEHDPLEIWDRTGAVIAGALKKAGLGPGDLAAVGVTNQRETTVVWDRETGRPYYHAVVWQDTRTDDLVKELAGEEGIDRFRGKVGLPLATYFSGPKLRWILDHSPEAAAGAKAGRALFGTIDSWLIWNLTGGPRGGVHVTDVTNASRTMLMNLGNLQWDGDMLEALNLPAGLLPEIRPSSFEYGRTAPDGPFGGEIPVAGDLGDQQAALFGQACFSPGEAKNTYGTGCFLLLNTGEKLVTSTHGLLTTLGYQIGDQPAVYALEGSIAVGGSLVQWFRDNLGLISESPQIEELAAQVPDSGGVYFVPAFSGLFAPHWRSDARGLIIGLTHYAGRSHLARAVLEAAAYQSREIFEAMAKDSGIDLTALKVDGGMVRNNLLMQFQADILGLPVIRPKISETTVLGAAYAAGLAVGFWKGVDELKENWAIDRQWSPTMPAEQREEKYAGWLEAVRRTYGWLKRPEA